MFSQPLDMAGQGVSWHVVTLMGTVTPETMTNYQRSPSSLLTVYDFMYVCMYVCMYVRARVRMRARVCMYVCLCVRARAMIS